MHTHTDGHSVGQCKDQFDKYNKLYWSLECCLVLWHIYTDCTGKWLSEMSTRQRVVAVMLSTYKSWPLYMLTRLVGFGVLLHNFYSCSWKSLLFFHKRVLTVKIRSQRKNSAFNNNPLYKCTLVFFLFPPLITTMILKVFFACQLTRVHHIGCVCIWVFWKLTYWLLFCNLFDVKKWESDFSTSFSRASLFFCCCWCTWLPILHWGKTELDCSQLELFN